MKVGLKKSIHEPIYKIDIELIVFYMLIGGFFMFNRIQNQQHAMTTSVNSNSELRSEITTTISNVPELGQIIHIENQSEINKEKIEEMVKTFNDFLTPSHTDLKFEFHEKLNEYYVTIVNSSTKEVVKEIPPRKMLDMYVAIAERIGLIVDQKI